MKKLICMLLWATLMLGATSCGDDDEPTKSSAGLFAGKTFSAEYNYKTGVQALMEFDGRGGVGYDGHFTITLYDKDGNKLNVKQNRSGKYQYDNAKSKLYFTFDDGTTNSLANYAVGSKMSSWPYWDQNIIITFPSSVNPDYSDLTFYPGNIFKNPNR